MSTIEEQIAALNAIADKGEGELTREADRAMRSITLEDILSQKQITECLRFGGLRIWQGRAERWGTRRHEGVDYTNWVLKEVIAPNMVEINQRLNGVMRERGMPEQENDPRYLAYAVTYVVEQMYKKAAR